MAQGRFSRECNSLRREIVPKKPRFNTDDRRQPQRYPRRDDKKDDRHRPRNDDGKENNQDDNFSHPNREVNFIIGGPSAFKGCREQKVEAREINSISTTPIQPLRWSETPVTFSRDDHWIHIPDPGAYPLVVTPVISRVKMSKVLIDGGSGLNFIFSSTLDRMKL